MKPSLEEQLKLVILSAAKEARNLPKWKYDYVRHLFELDSKEKTTMDKCMHCGSQKHSSWKVCNMCGAPKGDINNLLNKLSDDLPTLKEFKQLKKDTVKLKNEVIKLKEENEIMWERKNDERQAFATIMRLRTEVRRLTKIVKKHEKEEEGK